MSLLKYKPVYSSHIKEHNNSIDVNCGGGMHIRYSICGTSADEVLLYIGVNGTCVRRGFCIFRT